MTQILEYAPHPSRLKLATVFICRWCWLLFIIALAVPAWPYVAPALQTPPTINPGSAEQYWRSVGGLGSRPIYEVAHEGGDIIYASSGCGRCPGPFYSRVSERDLLAQRYSMAETAALLVSRDNPLQYGYLKAVTGKDFGYDNGAWLNWVESHAEAKNGPSAYCLAMEEWSRSSLAMGSIDPWLRESFVRKRYIEDVKEAGRFTWKVGLALATYLAAVLCVLRVNRVLQGRCRQWLSL